MVLNHHIRRYSVQKSLFSFRVQQAFIFLGLRLMYVIFWLYLRFRLCYKEELVTVSMYFLKALMSRWFLYVRMTLKVGCGIFSDDTEAATRGILREKVFLEISQNSGLMAATLLKKRLWHRCFPVNFVKFLRTPFLTERLWWLFLLL